MKKYQIGIVGYGDFTKVILEHLQPYADIVVSSRKHSEGDAGFGAAFAPLEVVLAQAIIIPSIPSQFFEDFLKLTRNVSIQRLWLSMSAQLRLNHSKH